MFGVKESHIDGNKFVNVDVKKIKCSCGCIGCLIKYGKYKRNIIRNGKKEKINIQRLLCKRCNKTHALLPLEVVPYKQTCIYDLLEVIEMEKNDHDDIFVIENERVLRDYSLWGKRINELNNNIRDNLEKVIIFCAINYKMCFMQSYVKKYTCKNCEYYPTYEVI